jgi:hypothetical protein
MADESERLFMTGAVDVQDGGIEVDVQVWRDSVPVPLSEVEVWVADGLARARHALLSIGPELAEALRDSQIGQTNLE